MDEKEYIQPSEFILPEWKGSPYHLWAKNFVYKNRWRVQNTLGDYDDCLEQCCLYYYQCYKFYKHKVNSPQSLMFYYRLWCIGQFNDLSNLETKEKKVIKHPVGEEDSKGTSDRGQFRIGKSVVINMEPVTESDAMLNLKLQEASSELKQVLNVMFNAPQEIIETLRQDCKSYCPKQYFKRVVKYLQLDEKSTPKLAKELEDLLS